MKNKIPKFKKGQEVIDNCGCHYIIKKVDKINYTCSHVLFKYPPKKIAIFEDFEWQISIVELDKRAKLC